MRGVFHFTRLVPNIEYILEKYNLSITLNTAKLWPRVGKKLKKGKSVSRTKELSFQF